MISVITPCLNLIKEGRKESFEKMMLSVHDQSYKPIEHIVVDGNSKDGTLGLIKKYKAKGWISKVIILKRNRKIYASLNRGILASKGQYINIMNTDDYITDKNFFNKSISMIKNERLDFTHADRRVNSKEGKRSWIKKGNEKQAFFRMPFRHQTMIVKKQLFKEIGLFDEKYKVASDYKWIMKMLLAGKKGKHIPRVFISSLEGGISSNRKLCIKEVSQVLYEIYGKKYNLSREDCKNIYLRKINLKLLKKIMVNIKNWKIKISLLYCFYTQQFTS